MIARGCVKPYSWKNVMVSPYLFTTANTATSAAAWVAKTAVFRIIWTKLAARACRASCATGFWCTCALTWQGARALACFCIRAVEAFALAVKAFFGLFKCFGLWSGLFWWGITITAYVVIVTVTTSARPIVVIYWAGKIRKHRIPYQAQKDMPFEPVCQLP